MHFELLNFNINLPGFWRLKCDLFSQLPKTLKIDTESNLFKVKAMQTKTCQFKIILKSVE